METKASTQPQDGTGSPALDNWMDILAALTCERRGLEIADIAAVEVYNRRVAPGCTATSNFVVRTHEGRHFHLQYAQLQGGMGEHDIAIHVNPMPDGRFPLAPIHDDPSTHWKRGTAEFEDAVAMVRESSLERNTSECETGRA